MNQNPKKPRKRRLLRKILVAFMILLIIFAALFYGYLSLKQEYTVNYDSYTASIGTISNALSFSGNLSLVNSASYTASASGEVRSVYVSAGDEVRDGDKLVRLNNGETIEAEFDGRINTISVEEGEDVSAGSPLVQVADFSHMKVTIRVDEYDICDVQVGQSCTVTATATEKQFDSEIASIDYISASGGNVAYYSAVCYVDVDDGIYPGMQVTVSIPQEEAKNVVILKMDALSFDTNNSAFVYMYNDEGALEEVSVEVGVSNGNYVEIKNGLADGDVVYAEAQAESANAMSGLLSGIFGSQQINVPGGMGGGMPDMSQMGGGEMPDFSQMGNRGNDSGSNRGGGQMGGGRQ